MENEMLVATAFTLSAQVMLDIPISLSDEDSNISTEEEEVIISASKKRKLHTPQRIRNYMEHIVGGYTAQQFQQHFRISIDAYEHILSALGPQLQKTDPIGRSPINIEKQILAVIWLLATPDSYRSVGDRFDLAKSSLSVCFLRIIKLLNQLAPRIIKWPERQQLAVIKRRFSVLAGLNNVIGAVDGAYIQIKAPKEDSGVIHN
uniref:DDE Tnp4 domain-containing protein n=1 Tax=Photinus pyralis TaxID=7054 RepID=A0A1Y1KIP5_PHOPY